MLFKHNYLINLFKEPTFGFITPRWEIFIFYFSNFFSRTPGQRDRDRQRQNKRRVLQVNKRKTNRQKKKCPEDWMTTPHTYMYIYIICVCVCVICVCVYTYIYIYIYTQMVMKYMNTSLTSLVIRRNTNFKIQIKK